MKSKRFRILFENGKKYFFNTEIFSNYIYKAKSEDKVSLAEMYERIANETGYSPEAVKKWKLGSNGVADIETIKIIARVLDIDYQELLSPIEEVEENAMENNRINYIVPEQNEALGCIYMAMLAYIKEYNNTWGFNLDLADDVEEAQNIQKDYYSEYRKVCDVVYSYALNLDNETYEKVIRILNDLERLIEPVNTEFHFSYVPKIWQDNNEQLAQSAKTWEEVSEDLYFRTEDYGNLSEEAIFDNYCDVLTREFINRFRTIIG